MADGFTLVLETSTPHASVALVGPDGTVERRAFQSDRNHNALLFGPLDDLLSSAGARGRLARVLVGSGPGSYSGTRVGIAAAQGVAIASGCPLIALPSLVGIPAAAGGAACMVVGDARRGTWWFAEVVGQRVAVGPVLCGAEELSAAVSGAVSRGMPVASFEDPLRYPLAAKDVCVEYPDSVGLWQAWLAADEGTRSAWAGVPAQPFYLKPPHITAAKRPWWAKEGA